MFFSYSNVNSVVRFGIFLFVLCCAVSSMALLVGRVLGDGDLLAFATDRSGSQEVFLMDVERDLAHHLIRNHGAFDDLPAWSPDGMRLLFLSTTGMSRSLYVMDVFSRRARRLFDTVTYGDIPVWSPDSTRIAFSSSRSSNQDIYVIDADDAYVHRLTSANTSDISPTWSPDGTQIAFVSTSYRRADINVIDVACVEIPGKCATSVRELTTNHDSAFSPVWSPDGQWIAFVSNRDGDNDIYVVNLDGDILNLTRSFANDFDPVWSPDGKLLLFVSDRDGVRGLYVLDAGCIALSDVCPVSIRRVISTSVAVDNPRWSPDGTRIVFEAGPSYSREDLYLVHIDGSSIRRLTATDADDEVPAWRP